MAICFKTVCGLTSHVLSEYVMIYYIMIPYNSVFRSNEDHENMCSHFVEINCS